ncbi:enterotoxin, partial [Bacillus sp. AFS059628]
SEILGKLNKNDVIETTNQVQNEWLQFDYNGKTGYVYVPFLAGTAPVIEKKEVVAQEEAPVRVNTPVKNNKVVKNEESVKNVESNKPVVKQQSTTKQVAKSTQTSAPAGGREITVEATAYTAHPGENGTYGGRVLTAMG